MRTINFFCAAVVSLFCVNAFAIESPSKKPPSKLSPSGTQMVLIGDAWNRADEWGHGFCSKNFYLGSYEWTVRDWKEKVLDLVACKVDVNNNDPALRIADPHGLWNRGMRTWITRKGTEKEGYVYSIVKGADLPITYVNLFDTFRACNIMQRVKEYGPSLGLEEGESFDEVTEGGGAYFITTTITPEGKKKQEAYRAVDYCFYIPTQNEWIKAAYYTPHKGGGTNAPGYYLYPTQHDSPNPGDREGYIEDNRANYSVYPLLFFAPALELSEVNHCGQYTIDDNGTISVTGTHSFYGCVDMAGNVNEWTTTRVKSDPRDNYRTEMNDGMITSGDEHGNYFYPVRGGDFESEYCIEPGVDNYLMRTCSPEIFDPNTRNYRIGFRMAAVVDQDKPAGKGFAETERSTGLSSFTTGQQGSMIILPVAAFAGAAIGAGIATGEITSEVLANAINFGGQVGEAIDAVATQVSDYVAQFFNSFFSRAGIEEEADLVTKNEGVSTFAPISSLANSTESPMSTPGLGGSYLMP
ncbi:MAG: SUMF1/EgtB/PvdO family nonheme iron enzyme [Chthoniobacterales bacterium]|nr:SUMF1/EgtB/PvdO family nonheme iron enzyme [Chthoniobacterales bacterium]